LLLKLLPEQRGWRRFARISNRNRLPSVSALNEFREKMGVGGFRQVNDSLLKGLIDMRSLTRQAVGLIDSTDLPAATSAFKKR
jgi:hypothetical protein